MKDDYVSDVVLGNNVNSDIFFIKKIQTYGLKIPDLLTETQDENLQRKEVVINNTRIGSKWSEYYSLDQKHHCFSIV